MPKKLTIHSLKKQPNPIKIFFLISFEMGITIFLFSKLGKWLDSIYTQNKTFTFSLTLVGFLLAFYLVYTQVNKLNK
jgi:hypothetical protein